MSEVIVSAFSLSSGGETLQETHLCGRVLCGCVLCGRVSAQSADRQLYPEMTL